MKQYFIDKLLAYKRKIDSITKHILDEVQGEMKPKELISMSERLTLMRTAFSEMQTDCMNYCTVDEVIEIADFKGQYDFESVQLIDYKSVRYYYQYTTKGITLEERDKLVKRFRIPSSDIKIK